VRCTIGHTYIEQLKEALGGPGEHDLPARALEEGFGWPKPYPGHLLTMLGRKRLDNLEFCVEEALRLRVPGDLIEAGVWRGGAAMLMRAVLAAHGAKRRKVVLADSFDGVPPPRPEIYPHDEGLTLHLDRQLAVGVDEVKANFARFNLLDDSVEFIAGMFRDTLPKLSSRRWAVVRLDGDLYESTMDGLTYLYPNLSPGGFLIVDDYGAYEACAAAIEEYRHSHGIDEEIIKIDWTGIYWQKREQ